MTGTVVAILFTPSAEGEAALRAIRARHGAARLIALTTPAAAPRLRPLADEVWADGLARGPSRLLALLRRLAWASPGHIYDLEATRLTRFMRLCVWPRPKWHIWPGGKGLS